MGEGAGTKPARLQRSRRNGRQDKRSDHRCERLSERRCRCVLTVLRLRVLLRLMLVLLCMVQIELKLQRRLMPLRRCCRRHSGGTRRADRKLRCSVALMP